MNFHRNPKGRCRTRKGISNSGLRKIDSIAKRMRPRPVKFATMKAHQLFIAAIAVFIAVFSVQAQIIQVPYQHFGAPPIISGYGGLGRAVTVNGLNRGIEVKSWSSPGVAPRDTATIAMIPPTETYEWRTVDGFVEIKPQGSPFPGIPFPLWLYPSLFHSAIRLKPLLDGTAVTAYGLPGSYGTESTILLPTDKECRGLLFVPLGIGPDAIRFSPVLVHSDIIAFLQ